MKKTFHHNLLQRGSMFSNAMNLWDKLIPQVLITLNLLQYSNLTPYLSVYAYVWGLFIFSHTPHPTPPDLPGNKVMVHKKPDSHKTWDSHVIEVWYVGPVIHHY